MQLKALVLAVFALCSATPSAWAQQGPTGVLVIDLDRLYQTSEYAIGLQGSLRDERLSLQSENRRIFDALRAEELQLTEQRKTLAPADFAALAADFEERVTEIRRTQDEKARQSDAQLDAVRGVFFRRAQPIINDIRETLDGAVVLPLSDGILAYDPSADITDLVKDRVDDTYVRSVE